MKSGFRLNNIKFSFNNSVKTTKDFFSKRRVTLFSINEDLNCQNNLAKLKNFEDYYDRIKKLGIHEIYCCVFQKFENVRSQFDKINIRNIKIIPDENGNFMKHLGVLNASSELKVANLNKNYMAIITDEIVEKWWEERKKIEKKQKTPFYSETSVENCIIYLSGTE